MGHHVIGKTYGIEILENAWPTPNWPFDVPEAWLSKSSSGLRAKLQCPSWLPIMANGHKFC